MQETEDLVAFDGIDNTGKAIYSCLEGTTVFRNVMVSRQSMGNILSFGNVVDYCDVVEYNKESDTFVITPKVGAASYLFKRNRELNMYVSDMQHTLHHERVAVATVAENIKKYTRRELKKAELAREYLRRADYMSAGQLIKAINTGKLKNSEITSQDVLRSIDIWGKDLGNLKGKTTAKKNKSVEITTPDYISSVVEKQDMHIDLLFVNGEAYMIALFQPLELAVAKKLKSQNQHDQWIALQSLMTHVTSRSLKIWRVRCDGESAIHTDYIKRKLPEGIELDPTAGAAAVSDVERKIRTVKERMRGVINTLPYKLSIRLEDWLLQSCLYYISFQPTVNTNDLRSPKEKLTGLILDAKVDLRFGYGDYCQVSDDDTDNTMTERTKGAIALMPVGNSTGSWWFLLLKTGKAVRRNTAEVLPMPDNIIDFLNDLAENDKRKRKIPSGDVLQIGRGHVTNVMYNDNDESNIDNVVEESTERLPIRVIPQQYNDQVLHGINVDDEDIDDWPAELTADEYIQDDTRYTVEDIFGTDSSDDSDALHVPAVQDDHQEGVVEQTELEHVPAVEAVQQEQGQRYNLRNRKLPEGAWRGAAAATTSQQPRE